MVEPKNGITKPHKALTHTHTHKRTHWYYIEDFFMGSCQLLHWVRSCVSQFYWFVTLPNHRRRKNCKKKRRESQRKSARNYGSDSAELLLYACIFISFTMDIMGTGQMKSQKNKNVKCQTYSLPSAFSPTVLIIFFRTLIFTKLIFAFVSNRKIYNIWNAYSDCHFFSNWLLIGKP